MSRLIDLDKLIGELLAENQRCITSTGHELTMSMMLNFINNQPTTYDVDKVVVELKKVDALYCVSVGCDKNCTDCDHHIIMNSVLNIVKRGGVDG